jgi:hypothetical protein
MFVSSRWGFRLRMPPQFAVRWVGKCHCLKVSKVCGIFPTKWTLKNLNAAVTCSGYQFKGHRRTAQDGNQVRNHLLPFNTCLGPRGNLNPSTLIKVASFFIWTITNTTTPGAKACCVRCAKLKRKPFLSWRLHYICVNDIFWSKYID